MKTPRRTFLQTLLAVFVGKRVVANPVVKPDADDWYMDGSVLRFGASKPKIITLPWQESPFLPHTMIWRETGKPEARYVYSRQDWVEWFPDYHSLVRHANGRITRYGDVEHPTEG